MNSDNHSGKNIENENTYYKDNDSDDENDTYNDNDNDNDSDN